MNDIKLLGRLAQDPQMSQSAKGRAYVWFTVAVSRRNDKDSADFIRCVAFDGQAEAISRYCAKGRQVLVEGRLQVSQSKDAKTGENRYHHTVVASSTHFLHDPSK